MSFESFEEIVEYATNKEKEAVAFYEEVALKAPSAREKEILEGFAREEKKHQAMFEDFGKNKEALKGYKFTWIPDIKRSNYIVDMEYKNGMDYIDLLRLAMKREENASKSIMEQSRLQVEREKIAASKQIADTKLQIAKENKNKYDSPKSKDDK